MSCFLDVEDAGRVTNVLTAMKRHGRSDHGVHMVLVAEHDLWVRVDDYLLLVEKLRAIDGKKPSGGAWAYDQRNEVDG